MATARIRTPDEPPSAAWNWQGANYVGFSRLGSEYRDPECQQCTTVDRTPTDPQILAWEKLPRWPDSGGDDPDWLPDGQLHSDHDPLEYDSGAESGGSSEPQRGLHDEHHHGDGDSDADSLGDRQDDTAIAQMYPLSELYGPFPCRERLPHGTWHRRHVYYTGNRGRPSTSMLFLDWNTSKVLPEHIASPSCQSLQGINGHVLSVGQMKNCRNVRFLIPKPKDWKAELSDKLLEQDSLFYLSGETNGSNVTMGNQGEAWASFFPPRHGSHELETSWEMTAAGCSQYEGLWPLQIHSHCLDIYAKVSFRRLGRVDLDGIWYWRELRHCSESDRVYRRIPPVRPEVRRARKNWDDPWLHIPGDEWLVANPVEVPALRQALEACMGLAAFETLWQVPVAGLLALPSELSHHIFSFLDLADLDAVARTCRASYNLTQSTFRACVAKDMPWLWEVSEGGEYPLSPDRPVTWDPLYLPGAIAPTLLVSLESEEIENAIWAEIVEEDPEMEEAGQATRALNRQKREELLAPYYARQELLTQEWDNFRAGVETWIRRAENKTVVGMADTGVDWIRLWWLFNPATTPLPGVRNRARIWDDCEQVMDCVALAQERGEVENERQVLLAKLADPSTRGFSTDPLTGPWRFQ